MNNGLVDEDKNIILPVMIVAVVVVFVLLLSGLFMRSPDWIF